MKLVSKTWIALALLVSFAAPQLSAENCSSDEDMPCATDNCQCCGPNCPPNNDNLRCLNCKKGTPDFFNDDTWGQWKY